MRFPNILYVTVAVAGVVVGTGGCAAPGGVARSRVGPVESAGLSKEDIADLLRQFEDTFEATVRHATERLVAANPDRRTRRLMLLWQTRVIPMLRDALGQDDALHGLLDAWVLCARQRDFFTDGDGQDLFGDHQSIAREAAARCVERIEGIAALVLRPQTLSDAREAVDELARKFPLRGDFGGLPVRTAVEQPDKRPDVLTSVLTAPIAPFRAFEGIDRGAEAIKGFTAVAARMTDVVNDLPESARLQTELLLMEVEEYESVQAALASFGELSRSSARLATVAESLPQDVRRELTQVLDELDARQANVQQTLGEARAVVEQLDAALERVERTAGPVEQLAVQVGQAGEAWAGMFQSFGETVQVLRGPQAKLEAGTEPTAAESSAAERQGFDINDWTRTAEALDQAAVQLQQLTREVRELAGAPELPDAVRHLEARMENLLSEARGGALGVADRAAWRAAQLCLLIFVLAVAYHLLTRRWPRPEAR